MSHVADIKVARRYASALFNAARKQSKAETIQTDLATLVGLWNATPTLRRTMESPLVPGDRKIVLLDQLFSNEVDALTRSFLHLLVEKRRENILLAVEEEYRRLADQQSGRVRAHATVAAALDASAEAALKAGLQQRTGKQVELVVTVDPQILGGVVVRMQDTIIDGSVRGSLERLREQMLQGH